MRVMLENPRFNEQLQFCSKKTRIQSKSFFTEQLDLSDLKIYEY